MARDKSIQLDNILRGPHVTEKATKLGEKNQYIFKVNNKANKIEIKKAVENLYKVEVLGVRVIRMPRKKRSVGKTSGFKSGFKKAIVNVKEGQKIEVVPR